MRGRGGKVIEVNYRIVKTGRQWYSGMQQALSDRLTRGSLVQVMNERGTCQSTDKSETATDRERLCVRHPDHMLAAAGCWTCKRDARSLSLPILPLYRTNVAAERTSVLLSLPPLAAAAVSPIAPFAFSSKFTAKMRIPDPADFVLESRHQKQQETNSFG